MKPSSFQISENLYDQIFDEAPVGIAYTDPNGNILNCNEAFCKLTGYSKQEIQELNFADITHPDDARLEIEYLNEMLAGKRNAYEQEKRYYHRDGKIVYVNLKTISLRDESGSIQYFLGIIEDITRQRTVEESARQTLQVTGRSVKAKNNFINRFSKEMAPALYAIQAITVALENDSSINQNDSVYSNIKLYRSYAESLLTAVGNWVYVSNQGLQDSESNSSPAISRKLSDRWVSVKKPNILILDEDSSCRFAFQCLFSSTGYQSKTAGSLAEAKTLLHNTDFAFHVMLIDRSVYDGVTLDVFQSFAAALPEEMIVLLATGSELPEVDFLPERFDGVLQKPFEFEELHGLLFPEKSSNT